MQLVERSKLKIVINPVFISSSEVIERKNGWIFAKEDGILSITTDPSTLTKFLMMKITC